MSTPLLRHRKQTHNVLVGDSGADHADRDSCVIDGNRGGEQGGRQRNGMDWGGQVDQGAAPIVGRDGEVDSATYQMACLP